MRHGLARLALCIGCMTPLPATIHDSTLPMISRRLTERRLADIAVIDIPASIKNEGFTGYRDDQPGRLTFGFSTAYFWASFGSTTAYKQLLIVSVMAPDATDVEYAAMPHRLPLSYERRKKVRSAVSMLVRRTRRPLTRAPMTSASLGKKMPAVMPAQRV